MRTVGGLGNRTRSVVIGVVARLAWLWFDLDSLVLYERVVSPFLMSCGLDEYFSYLCLSIQLSLCVCILVCIL